MCSLSGYFGNLILLIYIEIYSSDYNNNLIWFPGGGRSNNVGDSLDFEVSQQVALLPLYRSSLRLSDHSTPPRPTPIPAHIYKCTNTTHTHTVRLFWRRAHRTLVRFLALLSWFLALLSCMSLACCCFVSF